MIFDGNTVHLFDADENRQMHSVTVVTDKATSATGSSDSTVTSPMPGKIVRVLVSAGQRVTEGEALVVMEAMKMEHTMKAPADGIVEEVHGKEGEVVGQRALLISFEGES